MWYQNPEWLALVHAYHMNSSSALHKGACRDWLDDRGLRQDKRDTHRWSTISPFLEWPSDVRSPFFHQRDGMIESITCMAVDESLFEFIRREPIGCINLFDSICCVGYSYTLQPGLFDKVSFKWNTWSFDDTWIVMTKILKLRAYSNDLIYVTKDSVDTKYPRFN